MGWNDGLTMEDENDKLEQKLTNVYTEVGNIKTQVEDIVRYLDLVLKRSIEKMDKQPKYQSGRHDGARDALLLIRKLDRYIKKEFYGDDEEENRK